jgi:hypothetical protein
MSLKTSLKNLMGTLREAFERVTYTPFPEPEIQKEMEKEGWKFDFYHAAAFTPFGGGACVVTFVNAPNGDPAWNNNPTEAQKELFIKTVAEKRVARGLKP